MPQKPTPPAFVVVVAAAIESAGGEAVVVDLSDRTQGVLEPLSATAAPWPTDRFDLAFSIGPFGELRGSQGRSFAETVGAPHVVQYVDYPLSHHARPRATPPEWDRARNLTLAGVT